MAVSKVYQSQLRLVFDNGLDPETNKMITKRKNFNNVKGDATASQLFAVAEALSSLQQLPLFRIERVDQSQIVEE